MDLKTILGAVDTALGAIKTATNLPGVNLIPYVSTVSSAVGVIQLMLEQGQNVAHLVTDLKETFSGGLPSEDKRAALDARIAAARAKLHAPLPPKEEGETD
jgi:hypothetical protein